MYSLTSHDPSTECTSLSTCKLLFFAHYSNKQSTVEHKELKAERRVHSLNPRILASAQSVLLISQYFSYDHQFHCKPLLNFHILRNSV